MPVPTSRIERFISLIGGEENLPPKLPASTTSPDLTTNKPSSLPTDEHVTAQEHTPAEVVSPPHVKVEKEVASTPPAHSHIIHEPPANDDDVDLSWDPRLGESAPYGVDFTPFGAVTKYCYKFVRRELQQPLATAFFDAGKIFARDWDLYFIWSSHSHTAKPVIFIPEHQLQALLDEINQAFPKANLAITDDLREEGLVINFDDVPSELRPRWLGHSTSRAQHNFWTENLPLLDPIPENMDQDRSLEAFKAKMELAVDIAKNNKNAKKKQNQAQAVVRRQEMTRQVLRAQRYLGLLPKKEDDLIPGLANVAVTAIDPAHPTPYPQDMGAIFIAIDVEAYERPPKPITEVGVATLDTRDLRGEAPGAVGQNWQQHIRARHFRILEYKHLINQEFVHGCPEAFEFGDSEFVPKDTIASVLASCFHPPFSSKTQPSANDEEDKRNIILLGHDINQDIAYLHQLGFSVLNRSNLLETMDTTAMFRSHTRDPNARSLGSLLCHFDLTAWNLHNAGNDAVYTLWAMLAICVKDAGERGDESVKERHEDSLAKRMQAAVEQAKETARDGAEGWVSLGSEDGGVAVPQSPGDVGGSSREKGRKPAYGPSKPLPEGFTGFYTPGGVPLDV